ncbi:hypothetical protein NSQ82_20270 [Caldifermentibacillus hisashii]|uniref:hypothetical protein n=2 Tax=Bacillati TaxID=1783272 RepID=UPI0022B9C6EB|nr:hypothetical protein [Caldifermentibacillus hisashii]
MNGINEDHQYKDLDRIEYDDDTLIFLRKKLDEFTINIFKMIFEHNKQHRGLVKTRLNNYLRMRKRYDNAFLILESQGFIERKEDGTSTPYFLTVRGRQLMVLLKSEEIEREE